MRKCECCLDDAHLCKVRPPKDKEPVRGRKKKVRPCVQEMFPKEHPSGNWRDHLTETAPDLPLDYSELQCCGANRKDKDKKCRAQGRRGRSRRRRRAMSLERGTIRSRAKELGNVSPVRGRRASLPQRDSRPVRRERYDSQKFKALQEMRLEALFQQRQSSIPHVTRQHDSVYVYFFLCWSVSIDSILLPRYAGYRVVSRLFRRLIHLLTWLLAWLLVIPEDRY